MDSSSTQREVPYTNGHRHHEELGTFDARVHHIDIAQSQTVVYLLLRYADKFTPARIESELVGGEIFRTAQSLTPESLVRISGHSIEDDSSRPVLNIVELNVLAEAKPNLSPNILPHGAPGEAENPLAMSAEAFQSRLDNRILDARVTANAAVAKLFSAVFELTVEYLAELDFHRIPTPALIGWEFPGDEHEQFSLNYFDRERAWLSQTGDVHLEMALAADFERVYDVHTVFRREEQVSARHLTEFTTLEIMWAFKKDWTEIMDFSEKFLIFITHALQNRTKYSVLTKSVRRLYPNAGDYKLGLNANGRMLRLKFSEAKKILRDTLGRQSDDQVDVTKEEEAALGRYLASDESTVGPPTDVFFLTHFPKHTRPYNVLPSRHDDISTNSADIIMRGQEISTGYQCIHDYKELRHAMATRKHPIDADSEAWRPFVEAHEVGMPPLGGVAIGLNRLLQGILGAADIHETVLFPRDAERLRP